MTSNEQWVTQRGSRRFVATYVGSLVFGAIALTVSLLVGRGIDPAAEVPAFAAVEGAGAACLGERVSAVQSGEFVDLHEPGPAGSETVEEELGARVARGRIDRTTNDGSLHGSCLDEGRFAGMSYVATVTIAAAPDGDAALSGTLRLESGDTAPFAIVGTDPKTDRGAPAEQLSSSEVVGRTFLAVAVVIIASRTLGLLFALIRQPRVVGEIVAGILLGPSLVGAIFPEATDYLFPGEVISVLRVMAQFGLIFFMFLIGLELDIKLIRGSGRMAVLISHVSIVFPFALGSLLALLLFPLLGGGSFTAFALFMGAAMAITAFPVLARILTETGIHRTRLGALAITCAAVDDVTAWCILALVVGIVNATGPFEAVRTVVLSVAFVGGMLCIVRPAVARLADVYKTRAVNPPIMAGILCGLFLAAWTTEMIGIHAIFGAFICGVILPRSHGLATSISERIEDLTVLFLLPIFFAVVGLSTKFGLLDQPLHWLLAALVIGTAVLGKWGGSALAARSSGLPWRYSSALGLLMNTRGLTEIVILTVGRSLDVISPALFTIMVLMALVTTFMAPPLLTFVYPARLIARDVATLAASGTGRQTSSTAFRVLIAVGEPRYAQPLIRLARDLRDPEGHKPQIVLTHVAAPPGYEEVRARLSAWNEAEEAARARLAPLASDLLAAGYDTVIHAGVSTDPGGELVRLITIEDPDLVLVGWHRPIAGRNELGGVVRDVLDSTSCDVGVLVEHPERAFNGEGPIAVPGNIGNHYLAAMDLAVRLARGSQRPLHLIQRTGENRSVDVPAQVTVGAFYNLEFLLDAVRDASLVVVGVGDRNDPDRADARQALIGQAVPPVLLVQRGRRRAEHPVAVTSSRPQARRHVGARALRYSARRVGLRRKSERARENVL